jgi:hypothetical protein
VLIGVDFDNTIVCYDEVFRQVALERGLIPATVPTSKTAVREYLRQAGNEDAWTELQGYVYGCRMPEAKAFPGVLNFFAHCRQADVRVVIISHRTRRPYRGADYDLHEAARNWLSINGFHDPQGIALAKEDVWLEVTKQGKLERIATEQCSHFVDDLPEFLVEPGFPPGVRKILFDPNRVHPDCHDVRHVTSWAAVEQLLLPQEA